MPGTLPPPKPAPVQRHHRLAVIRAHGWNEADLLTRTTHYAYRWLEGGDEPKHFAGVWSRLAQELADMEAAGLLDREAHARGLRQIIDRVDRAIADELGQSDDPPDARYANVDGELVEVLDQLAQACDRDAVEQAEPLVLAAARRVSEVWRHLYLCREGEPLPGHQAQP